VAIGAGAYVSGPIAWIASFFGSKIVLLEQNSYPGVTNRILQKKADSIHITFEDSSKYFKSSVNLKLTGNPVRTTLQLINKDEAIKSFSFDSDKKVLLVIGGSLGARSLNKAVAEHSAKIMEHNVQIIWQTGELYYDEYKHMQNDNLKIYPFIVDMGLAYSACDLLLARAGATTIAEVAYLGLPVIFVPSVNVAANHQYKNAKSMSDNKAGLLIEDSELKNKLGDTVVNTITDNNLLRSLKQNIVKFSKPDAAKEIALDVLRLAQSN
jgi:UDP-N-acetylglucosamine--N-acetylmuramyl-(pentapeptide) pyrophosphoryl-undecaprenol N-acetylglucosamine transferase